MLSEFFEALHQSVNGGEFFVPQTNSQTAQAMTDCQHVLLGEPELERGIDRVDRDSDGNGFSVADAVSRQWFETMGGPVTEVEGTSFQHLKGVAAFGDVFQVQDAGTVNSVFRGDRIPFPDGFGVVAEPREFRFVF